MSTDAKPLVSIKRAALGSYWSNRSPNGQLFKNLGGINKKVVPFNKFLKWYPRRVVKNLPKKPVDGYKGFGEKMYHPCNMNKVLSELRADPATAQQNHAFWIGHASQLLCVRNGINILLDPVYCRRASPFQFIGPKRKYPPATTLDELPPIDIVLISHNHYDHLCKFGVKGVYSRNPNVRFVVPMKMSTLICEWGIPRSSITEMDWQDEVIVKGVVICCTPAQHWGKHSLFDNNKVLWCGWVVGWSPDGKPVEPDLTTSPSSSDADGLRGMQIAAPKYSPLHSSENNSCPALDSNGPQSLDGANLHRTSDNLLAINWSALTTYYFTGDTAFNEVVFELIHARIDHIDMAALPIGAYAPRWFMHGQHIDPEGAVRVFSILHCKRAYGVHYGTFELADDALDEPPRVLQEALSLYEVPSESFVTIPMGHHVSF